MMYDMWQGLPNVANNIAIYDDYCWMSACKAGMDEKRDGYEIWFVVSVVWHNVIMTHLRAH